MFTYTAEDEEGNPINMNGGRVRLDVPAAWKVKDTQITVRMVKRKATLFLTSARLTAGDRLNHCWDKRSRT